MFHHYKSFLADLVECVEISCIGLQNANGRGPTWEQTRERRGSIAELKCRRRR